MRLPAALSASALVACHAYGAFAPIPEREQGEPVVVDLRAGVYHDSNIFGASAGEVDSMIYSVSPQVRINASLTQQTFLRARYELDAQSFEDRPGDDTLYNHVFDGILSHRFSERASARVYDTLAVIDSPESPLPLGPLLQADQSFWSNTLGAAGSVDVSERFVLEPAASVFGINYNNNALARDLDRVRQELSTAVVYRLSRQTRLVAEGRYRTVEYDADNNPKGADSIYALAGVDYDVEELVSVSARAGMESRDRKTGDDVERFHAELSTRYEFTENSWVSAGLNYGIDETDASFPYMDASGPTLVLAAQYDPTGAARLYFTGTISYASRTLNARSGSNVDDADEDVLNAGLAAIWNAGDRWSLRGTLDYQETESELASREQDRIRVGFAVSYTFGLFE